jgi:hypothetical protein
MPMSGSYLPLRRMRRPLKAVFWCYIVFDTFLFTHFRNYTRNFSIG